MKNKEMKPQETVTGEVKEELSLLVPGATYKWEPETIFNIDGNEFTTTFNTLNSIVTSQAFQEKVLEAKQTLALVQVFDIAQKMLQKSVTKGDSKIIKLPEGMSPKTTPSEAIMDGEKKN